MYTKNDRYFLTIEFRVSDDQSFERPIHHYIIASERLDLIKRDYLRLKKFCTDYTDMLGTFFFDDYESVAEEDHHDDEFDKAIEKISRCNDEVN